jgi:hypothetical protein
MRESVIETKVSDYAKSHGWGCYKFTSPGRSGVPDRLYIRNGIHIFIEFKATGKQLRPLQVVTINKMEGYGAKVYVVSSYLQGKEIFDAYKTGLTSGTG